MMSISPAITCLNLPYTLRKKSPYSELFWSAFFSEYLSVFSPNVGKSEKNADQNNSEYGLFLRRANCNHFSFNNGYDLAMIFGNSSHRRCSMKKALSKNFTIFTEKYLSAFLIKLQTFRTSGILSSFCWDCK